MKRKTFGMLLVILSSFALVNCGQSSGNAPSISSGSSGGDGDGGGGTTACNPCKIFATSATYQGDFGYFLGSIAAADQACASDTNKPSDGSTYKALIMSPSRSLTTDWVLHPSTTYVRADGTTVITSTGTDGKLDTLNFSNSITGTSTYFWTGIKTGWVANTSASCDTWGDGTSSFSGAVGNGSSTGYASIGGTAKACDSSYGFYCVQQ